MQNKNRDNTFDIIKGIGILLVIIGHLAHGYGVLIPIIYTFHMPLFFIVSGYFYKEKGVKELFKRDFRVLIIPYLIISMIFIFYGCIMYIIKHDIQKLLYWIESFLHPGIKDIANPLWFILAMFWCRMFYNLIYKHISKITKYSVLVLFIISFCTFLIISYFHTIGVQYRTINYHCIITGGASMTYFSIGHLWRKYKDKIRVSHILLIISIIVCLISIYFSIGTELRLLNQNPISNVLAAISTTFIIYWIANNINKFKNSISFFLTWFGRLSLVVFFAHTIMFRILPIDKIFESILSVSNIQLISFLSIIFHIIITICFCKCTERSRYLKLIFNLK